MFLLHIMNGLFERVLERLLAVSVIPTITRLLKSVNGLYKSELINLRKWQGVEDVEWETLCWVHWWNSKRLHSSLGYSTPQEVEDRYWEAQEAEIAGRLVVTA